MRIFFVAALLLVSVVPFASADASEAPCTFMPTYGPGVPPSSVTFSTSCLWHCSVLVEVYPEVYELHPECLGP